MKTKASKTNVIKYDAHLLVLTFFDIISVGLSQQWSGKQWSGKPNRFHMTVDFKCSGSIHEHIMNRIYVISSYSGHIVAK